MTANRLILNCSEVVDLLAGELARELALTEALKLKLHLALCRDCRRFRRTYLHTARMIEVVRASDRQASLANLPDQLVKRVELALLAARRGSQRQ